MNWVSQLEVNPKTGHAATTVENIRIIVKNDPRFKGAFYSDEFMERPMVCGDLPWRKAGPKPRSWDDTDDAGVHNILEKDYKIDSMPKTREGVDLATANPMASAPGVNFCISRSYRPPLSSGRGRGRR